jgi:hypothetical protein
MQEEEEKPKPKAKKAAPKKNAPKTDSAKAAQKAGGKKGGAKTGVMSTHLAIPSLFNLLPSLALKSSTVTTTDPELHYLPQLFAVASQAGFPVSSFSSGN